ncbi:MAG: hypothetical protein H0X65_00710 [Gemmatimonadetes bacterium]|nr:hypothetical protein [Gemmatimonadota bacterium]
MDLLIRLRPSDQRPPPDLFDWFALEEEVGEQLGHRAEITTEDDLSRHVRPYLEPDRIVLYEE